MLDYIYVSVVFREAQWDFLEKKEKKKKKTEENYRITSDAQCSPTFPLASSICEACERTLAHGIVSSRVKLFSSKYKIAVFFSEYKIYVVYKNIFSLRL